MRIRIVQQIQALQSIHKGSYFNFRKQWELMYGYRTEGRINKKLKSIRHYIVHNDMNTAWKFYRQLEKAIKEKYPEYE